MAERSEWKQDAKSKAAEFAANAQDTIHREAANKAEEFQSGAAERVQNAANAASAAAAQFDPHTMQAEAVRRVAEGIEGVANKIRTTDMDTVIRETSEFARRNPLLFVGAAAAVGFAATRFLKAKPPARSYGADPWSSTDATFDASAEDERSVLSNLNGGRHAG